MQDTTEAQLQHAQLFINQGNWPQAEKALRQLLSQAPDHGLGHYLMGVVMHQTNTNDRARQHIEAAMRAMPSFPWNFYMMASFAAHEGKLKEATEWIEQAIGIDPEEASFHAYAGRIALNERNYEKALEHAGHALAIDPEHVDSLNLRSNALMFLGRKDEAFRDIDAALHNDPENPNTHASMGWAKLHGLQHKEALEHFKQALMRDPESETAKGGMSEALKARSPIYRAYLRYMFWMAKQGRTTQWVVIIGFVLVSRLFRSVAEENPDLAPFLYPLVFLIALFGLSTWLLGPVHNLFLLASPYGKYALSRQERRDARAVGGFLALALVGLLVLGASLALEPVNYFIPGVGLGVYGLAAAVLFSSMNQPQRQRQKQILQAFAVFLLVLGGAIAVALFFTGEVLGLAGFFLVAFFIYQWVANRYMM